MSFEIPNLGSREADATTPAPLVIAFVAYKLMSIGLCLKLQNYIDFTYFTATLDGRLGNYNYYRRTIKNLTFFTAGWPLYHTVPSNTGLTVNMLVQ